MKKTKKEILTVIVIITSDPSSFVKDVRTGRRGRQLTETILTFSEKHLSLLN